MSVPDNFVRFYRDGFGMIMRKRSVGDSFYYVSEKQELLDWVLEPVDEEFRFSKTIFRVPLPEGIMAYANVLNFDTPSLASRYSEEDRKPFVFIPANDPLTAKARAILPLMYNVYRDGFHEVNLPVYRIFQIHVEQ